MTKLPTSAEFFRMRYRRHFALAAAGSASGLRTCNRCPLKAAEGIFKMNRPFLSTHRLLLTPLSPIHIGCGMDYEPTNSVIDTDRNFLYSFNLGLVRLLPQERRGLMAAAQNGVIEEINRFYARQYRHLPAVVLEHRACERQGRSEVPQYAEP